MKKIILATMFVATFTLLAIPAMAQADMCSPFPCSVGGTPIPFDGSLMPSATGSQAVLRLTAPKGTRIAMTIQEPGGPPNSSVFAMVDGEYPGGSEQAIAVSAGYDQAGNPLTQLPEVFTTDVDATWTVSVMTSCGLCANPSPIPYHVEVAIDSGCIQTTSIPLCYFNPNPNPNPTPVPPVSNPVPPPPPAPAPVVSPPPPPSTAGMSPSCVPEHGSVGQMLLRSLKCTGTQMVLITKCGVNVALLLVPAAKAVKLIDKGAKLSTVLASFPAKSRPVVKAFWDLAHFKILKGAPKGYGTTKDLVKAFLDAKTRAQFISLLPNLRKAVSRYDYNQFALDLTKIAGLDSCVQAVVNG